MGKNFRTLDEQIDILKFKGLTFNDEEWAKEVLLKENYFFVNGYRFLLMKSDKNRKFEDNATFKELYAIFSFDRMIRNAFFKYLLIIENNIKSIISYQMSKKYGYKEKEYLNVKNFTQDSKKIRQVNDLIKKMKRQIRVNSKQHSATLHYLSNYGYIPLWVLVKVLSFGIVSELYSILKTEDQLAIANEYGIDVTELTVYLPVLANYRNLCAHEDILYTNRTQRSIKDTIYHEMLNIPEYENEYIYGKQDLFALVIIMKQLLSGDEFAAFLSDISYETDILDGKIDSIGLPKILEAIGFPSNWRDIGDI